MVKIDWNQVDEEIKSHLLANTRLHKYAKNELLLASGDICNELYIIDSGMMRNFYYDKKGNDITHWFSGKDTIVTSPPSFFNREPSFFRIEAIVETSARVITYKQLENAFDQSHQLERFVRKLVTNIMITLGRKVIDLQTKTAEERYNDLLSTHPDIFQQAKLGHISGYLGIAQQSFSRIRANHS